MLDSDEGDEIKYPHAAFNTKHHGTNLDLPKIFDMTDQGQEESALFTRRNAVEASPMSDNVSLDSVVSDSQINEQQNEESSHSNLETLDPPTIQILDEDEDTNMEFDEETLEQRHETDKQISIEMTEEQTSDTDKQLREELMKETGVIFTENTSRQNDNGIKFTISRESSVDLTEGTWNQVEDSISEQLDNTREESMDEDKPQSRKIPKVRPLFLGERIRFGKEVKKLGQLVNERRQRKRKKKADRESGTGNELEQESKEHKEPSIEKDAPSQENVPNDAVSTTQELQTASSAIYTEILNSSGIDDKVSPDLSKKKPETDNQDKKKPEKRKMKQEEEAEGTVDNPKKKKKKSGKWSERKREQAKLLKEARVTKREERLRRERVKERLKELEERYHQADNQDNEELEQADEATNNLPEDSSVANKAAVHIPVLKRYVLEEDRETKEVLIEIDPVLLAKLKPHQVEAVRFMYDCCIESVDIVNFDQGGGCILAHCMGLGKTLSVISFVYTLMSQSELTTIKKSLIVCPLNTVKNWVNEFQKWTSDLNYEIDVYELSNVKESKKRGELLYKWSNDGGVMILGYEMYRNLVQAGRGKVRVQKETYTEVLADPGPDIVICDEGHILKNCKSQSYKAMNRIRTRRRVILTGTPLQNNLKEYYHMVNYVKPLLLSTMKNFTQRFIDPITAGQCKDSSPEQIDNMRGRVHVLHKILGGCVQRKDYSALTKFLPPKHEYVISVRMGTEQCALYKKYLRKKEKYLYQTGWNGVKKISGRNARLFKDYQNLMRIWTHPWLLTQDREKKDSKVSKSQTPTDIREAIFHPSPLTMKDTEPVDCSQDNSVKLCLDVQNSKIEGDLDVKNIKIEPGLDVQNSKIEPGLDVQNSKIEPDLDVQNSEIEPDLDVQSIKIEPGLDVQNSKIEPGLDVQNGKVEPGLDLQNVNTAPGMGVQNMKTEQGLDVQKVEPGLDVQNINIKTEPGMDLQNVEIETDLDVQNFKLEPGLDMQNVKIEPGLHVKNVNIDPGLNVQNMEIDSGMDVQNMEIDSGTDMQNIMAELDVDVQYDTEENTKDLGKGVSPSPPHLDPVGEVSTLEENPNRGVPSDDRNVSPFDYSLSRSEQTSPVIKPEYEEPSNLSWPIKADEALNISDEEQSPNPFTEYPSQESPDTPEVLDDWWREHVTNEDGTNMSMSGKIMLLFEILEMCRLCKDKLLVFSQSIPSLNLIEAFLGQQTKSSSTDKGKLKVKKTWIRDKDYFRIDGTTSAQKRKEVQKSFNDPENERACLFLISTKAGSLGTNLVAANRVIIFDASWNPSHDVQSIFRVYRFGQVKTVYVYRFLAQGTMEEKIYERQVTKQSLSQRVIDEQQIERHFTAADLQALYEFKPDRLDDPDREPRPLPNLPKDELLASLMTSQKDWIVTFHEHDSLLENIEEEELTEEEKIAAWSEYERKALHIYKPASPDPFTGASFDDQPQPSPVHQMLTNSEDFQNIDSEPVDLDAWFDKPDNFELLSTLKDLIEEKCPDILMQDDLNPEIPKQDLPRNNLESQTSFGYSPYQPDQRDITGQQVNSFAASNNNFMVNYDNSVQGPSTSTYEYGSTFATENHPHQDYPYKIEDHVAQSVTDSVVDAAKPSNGIMANEKIGENNFNASEQLISAGNPSGDSKLTLPDTEPLDLSFVEDLSPVNMYKQKRGERDLNTPELIITDEQRSESNSDTRSSIGDRNRSPTSYHNSSPVSMSYKKPKQRMLERLRFESMDTNSSTFTPPERQSPGNVPRPHSVLETVPLNLSSRDTPSPSSTQQTVPLNLSVRDKPMQASLIPSVLTFTDPLNVDTDNYILDDSDSSSDSSSTSTSVVGQLTDTLNYSSETHTLTIDGNQDTRRTDQVSTDSRFPSDKDLDPNTLFNSSDTSTLKGDSNQQILTTDHETSDSNSSLVIQLDTDTLSNSSEKNIKGDSQKEILPIDQVSSDSSYYLPTHLETGSHDNSNTLKDNSDENLYVTDEVSSDSSISSSSVTKLDSDTHSNSSDKSTVQGDSFQEIHKTDQITSNSTSSPVIQLDTDTPTSLSNKSFPKYDDDGLKAPMSSAFSDVSDGTSEVNNAADEHSGDFEKLNIPSVVLENTVLRQESETSDTHTKSSTFSPIKTSDYEDISDSEEEL